MMTKQQRDERRAEFTKAYGYTAKTTRPEKCPVCAYGKKNNSNNTYCFVLKGSTSSNGTCNLFKPKTESTTAKPNPKKLTPTPINAAALMAACKAQGKGWQVDYLKRLNNGEHRA